MTKTTALRRTLGTALTATALLLATIPASADPIPGTVDDATATTIKVSGRSYKIQSSTTIEDQGGARIGIGELKPGTAVELELDGEDLVNVRASLIR